MKTNLNRALAIDGGIMIVLLVLGAFANAYGAHIPLNYITNLSIPLIVISCLIVLFTPQPKEGK